MSKTKELDANVKAALNKADIDNGRHLDGSEIKFSNAFAQHYVNDISKLFSIKAAINIEKEIDLNHDGNASLAELGKYFRKNFGNELANKLHLNEIPDGDENPLTPPLNKLLPALNDRDVVDPSKAMPGARRL